MELCGALVLNANKERESQLQHTVEGYERGARKLKCHAGLRQRK